MPKAVVKKVSALYNKGRVWINRGRASKIALWGLLFLCMMGRPDTWSPEQQVYVGGEFYGQDFEDARNELVT